MNIATRSFLRFFFVSVFLLSLFIVAPNSKAGETLINVDTTMDDLALQACTSSPGDCSLRGAINKANNDLANTYTIFIPAGVYTLALEGSNEDNNTTGDLDILVSMNLEGEGIDLTVLQAGASAAEGIDRVLDIISDGHDIQIYGLTIRNGRLPENNLGAGIQMFGDNLSLYLERVAVRDNLGEGFVLGGGIFADGDLDAVDCQVTGNQTGGDGGGIYQSQYGTVTLERVLISGNSAELGGGFTNGNIATLTNVTVSGNTASVNGGGISQWNNGNLTMHYSTIANNSNTGDTKGWAVYTSANWTMKSFNSIITAEAGKSACSSVMDDGHHNIGSDSSCGVGIQVVDPGILPLADYGGRTLTHALGFGSPAIDAAGTGGDANPCPGVDQRGVNRPIDGDFNGVAACDIGAYELEEVYRLFVPMLETSN